MAIANGNSTTPPCEMLFQLKPARICLSLCLLLSPASFNLLITCESLKQSASENKSSAVFFKNEIQLLTGKTFLGSAEGHEGDEDTETCTLHMTAPLTATRDHLRCSCSTNLVSPQSTCLTSVLSGSTKVGRF